MAPEYGPLVNSRASFARPNAIMAETSSTTATR
jgi:hypothetical protein